MWTTVLVLAIAVNFEPTRIGLVPLMLVRPRPILQLLAFLCGSLAISSTVGLLVLFVIHYKIGAPTLKASAIQVVMGVLVLLVAAVIAANPGFVRRRVPSVAVGGSGCVESPPRPPGPVQKFSARARGLLEGSSPWFSGATGVVCGLPSIDTLALLTLIVASGVTPLVQASAFLTFVAIGHAVVALPIASYVFAPERTRTFLARIGDWVAAHRRQYIATLVAVAGCLMTAIGISGL